MERDELILEIANYYEHPEKGLALLGRRKLTYEELDGLHKLSRRGYLRREKHKINHSIGLLEIEVENILEKRKIHFASSSPLAASDSKKTERTPDYDHIVDENGKYSGRYGIWSRD